MTEWQGRAQRVRYDEFADWYIPWVGESPGLICDSPTGLMPVQLSGERWLDVACGAGRTSRELGRRGASVMGVDISPELISRARASEGAQSLDISYLAADVTRPAEWWDGQPFDGAVCEMAFMDIDDLDGAVAAVAQVLRPAGRFLASLVNPCFPGSDVGLSSWPPDRGTKPRGSGPRPTMTPRGYEFALVPTTGSCPRT